MSSSSSNSSLSVPAADILRLIQAHLLEAGLSRTAQALSKESGVGLAGSLQHPNNWIFHCAAGNYAVVLEQLGLIDRARAKISNDLVAAVHELAILEVAEAGDLNVAASMLRMMYNELQESMVMSESNDESDTAKTISRARILDQKLADLASRRAKDPSAVVSTDWYYAGSKQQMRDKIGKALAKAIPHQPTRRLTTLLQQAVQWQAYTGELPQIKQWWDDDEGDANEEQTEKPAKRKKRKKQFDLVLGQASVDPAFVQETAADNLLSKQSEPYAKDPYSVVKLGKKVRCECAAFLPDSTGLVTGSSDGLIEIWDAAHQYTQLNLDLPYQQAEELLGQDTAVTAIAISNDVTMLASGGTDGRVLIWRIDTGKCLRTIKAHQAGISCLVFSPDASHVLVASQAGLVRDFGLRTARMLKEYTGHRTFVGHVSYQMIGRELSVITASGDGTLRIYNNKSLDAVRILRPISLGGAALNIGSSIAIDAHETTAHVAGSAAIHTVLHLYTPASSMIIVPRCDRAFLVNYLGTVVRIFEDVSSVGDKVFVAAAVSPSNRSLYCVREDGVCCIFCVDSGDLVGSIHDFGEETTRVAKDSAGPPEVSRLLSHPTKNVIAAYSNDAGQNRGQVVIWS